jgi:hypothetical protein
MDEFVWVVSLGDGTFKEIDSDVIVAKINRDTLRVIDYIGGEFFEDCEDPLIIEHKHFDDAGHLIPNMEVSR